MKWLSWRISRRDILPGLTGYKSRIFLPPKTRRNTKYHRYIFTWRPVVYTGIFSMKIFLLYKNHRRQSGRSSSLTRSNIFRMNEDSRYYLIGGSVYRTNILWWNIELRWKDTCRDSTIWLWDKSYSYPYIFTFHSCKHCTERNTEKKYDACKFFKSKSDYQWIYKLNPCTERRGEIVHFLKAIVSLKLTLVLFPYS